jgi:hypothetical protein
LNVACALKQISIQSCCGCKSYPEVGLGWKEPFSAWNENGSFLGECCRHATS